jgi:hypothetical protein
MDFFHPMFIFLSINKLNSYEMQQCVRYHLVEVIYNNVLFIPRKILWQCLRLHFL